MWNNRQQAIQYGVTCGAFSNYNIARAAYMAMRAFGNLTTQDATHTAWRKYCDGIVAEDNRPLSRLDSEAMACIYGYDGPIY